MIIIIGTTTNNEPMGRGDDISITSQTRKADDSTLEQLRPSMTQNTETHPSRCKALLLPKGEIIWTLKSYQFVPHLDSKRGEEENIVSTVDAMWKQWRCLVVAEHLTITASTTLRCPRPRRQPLR